MNIDLQDLFELIGSDTNNKQTKLLNESIKKIQVKPIIETLSDPLDSVNIQNYCVKNNLRSIVRVVKHKISNTYFNKRLLEACGNSETTLNVIKKILQFGADPNAKDELGKTSLLRAIEANKDVFIIRLLIQAGANVFAKDDNGKSAFEYFKNYGHSCWILAEYSAKSYLPWSTYMTMVVSYLPTLIEVSYKIGGFVGLKYLDHYLDNRIPAPIAKDFMIEIMNNNVRLFSKKEIEEEKGILKFLSKWNRPFALTPKEIRLFEYIHCIELHDEKNNNDTTLKALEKNKTTSLNKTGINKQINNSIIKTGDKEIIRVSNLVEPNEKQEERIETNNNLVENDEFESIVEYLKSIRMNSKTDELDFFYIDNNATIFCDKCGKEFSALSGKRCPFCSKKINTEIWQTPDKFFYFFYHFKGKDFLQDVKQSHLWIEKHFIGNNSHKKVLKDVVTKLKLDYNKIIIPNNK